MKDDHESVFTEELATSLHATAALTPRAADPYGSLAPAIARARRRRTTIGASLAVVAVLGAAVGIGSTVGRGGTSSSQTPAAAGGIPTSPAAADSTTTAPPTTTSPATHTAPNAQSSPPPSTKISQPMMLGWPTDYSLFPGFQQSTSEAKPTVDAMINAYGKPVDAGTRNVLDNLVGSFKLCGYSLASYTFTLRWAGDLAHSGGNGAAIVDITHGGATYRMTGFDSYKGIWLQLPAAIDPSEVSHAEAAPLAELDQPAQTFYAPVIAAPGSKVTVSGTKTNGIVGTSTAFQSDTVVVGPSGVAEVKLTSPDPQSFVAYPTITAVTIARPDGTTATAPLLGGTSTAQEQSARELLPSNTTCPGLTPEKPLS